MTTQLNRQPQDYKQRNSEAGNGIDDGVHQNGSDGNSSLSQTTLGLPKVVDTATAEPPLTPHAPNIRTSWWQRQSVRTKATVMAIALSTLPLLAIGAIAYNLTNKKITENVTQQQQTRVISLANQLDRFTLDRYKDIQTLSQMAILTNPRVRAVTSKAEKEAVLNQYIQAQQGYDSIAVTDIFGNVILQSAGKVIPNYRNIDYFQQVIRTNRPVITSPRKSLATGEYVMFVAAPVIDTVTGRTIGVVRSRTPARYINQLLQAQARQLAQNVKGLGSEEYLILNDLGQVFVAPTQQNDYVGRKANLVFPSAASQLKATDAVGSVVDINGNRNKYIVSYAPAGKIGGLPELNWGVMVAQPIAQAFAASRGLLLTLVIGTGATVLLVGAIAALLVNRALRPVLEASQVVKKLGQGQLNTRIAAVEGQDELAVLGSNVNLMADQLQALLRKQEAEAEQAHLFTDVTLNIRRSLNLEDILKTAVRDVRKLLKTQRVVIYRFHPDWSGTVVAESVAPGWTQALAREIDDTCFMDHAPYVEQYKNGRVRAIDNIYEAGLTDCYIRLLEQFEVKANLVAPILRDNKLLGLMIAHQCSAPRAWQQLEIDLFTQLAIQVGFAVDQANLLEQVEQERAKAEYVSQEQRRQKEMLQLFADVTLRIRQTLNVEDILKTSVSDVRKVFKTERVVIYRFNSDLSGNVVAESVASGWTKALGEKIDDPCFKERYLKLYQQGRIRAINNIYEADLSPCLIKSFEQFEVKASLIAPILKNNQLLGLLITHQCSGSRSWQQSEIDLFTQLATQIGFALDQANLLEQLDQARSLAESVSQEQRQQKEALQHQLVELLTDIEGASSGDLTVRAEVTAGEIGTVADFFNAIVESLRQIVISVKKAASQVNVSVGDNEGAIRQLANEAFKQAEDITRTLDSVEQMAQSIQAVADNAGLAAEVARTASNTAEAGEAAMDRTVQSILNLRETVAETANKVKHLGESSQQISKVVFLINQIALQTNVLAINASIEAARAGEEGRGFAVVAEEVGQLAAKSGAATKEIEQIVENIQLETSEVVRAMELGTNQVIEGTHLVADTKKSLGQISDVSRQINQLVQSISSATVSQAQTSQAVTHLMKEIAKVSERTTESSRQVSSSLKQTVEVAQQLQASVGTFKVGTET